MPRNVRMVIAGWDTLNGKPDFYFCIVRCQNDPREDEDYVEHYEVARQAAELEGYDSGCTAFSEDDGHDWLFDHFIWESATIFEV